MDRTIKATKAVIKRGGVMDKFKTFSSVMAPLDRANIDTDAIIPKQFLKSIKKTGFGVNLFDEWRYLDKGEPGQDCRHRPVNPDFILNQKPFNSAQILLTRDNFGCGSSREHAPWALKDFGIKVIIAPSFADIFYSNCFKNGLLPIQLSSEQVDELFKRAEVERLKASALHLTVDLQRQCLLQMVSDTSSESKDESTDLLSFPFSLDAGRKQNLLEGLDDIGETLKLKSDILRFEQQHQQQYPWVFSQPTGVSGA
ncbi:3-isopropylmalate dehydratase small subunit [Pleionea mediterranea]|uniref:3-isopropylmalate dehydratase small subunit n=2 Tax=Pleionea mediterranea TaxID=523701 RepID=A0A316FNL7_9GAMM|nr:3-isopropylmalate dehydratase small subunit [Pleionea mediterranea]